MLARTRFIALIAQFLYSSLLGCKELHNEWPLEQYVGSGGSDNTIQNTSMHVIICNGMIGLQLDCQHIVVMAQQMNNT